MIRFNSHIDGYFDVENQLIRYIYSEAEEYFEREEREKELINSVDQFEDRRKRIQQDFNNYIGALPNRREDISPEYTDTIQKKDYKIEKIILESLPNFHMTANFYLPNNIEDKIPGVLFLCGHTDKSKAYPKYQKVCNQLVRSGFAVLIIDPIGQGERKQYYNKSAQQSNVGDPVKEHSYLGQQCMYLGTNIARYFIADGKYGLDFLVSRPEVDETRLAVTGNSGGGTQSCYLMMCDDRISAAAPCTFITSREDFLKSGLPHDAEQNIYKAIESGINHDDFITSIAPKPVLIGAVQSDFFPIEGTYQSYNRAKQVYELYNKSNNIKLKVSPGSHEYTKSLRDSVTKWFNNHLQNGKDKIYTGKLNTLPENKLNATQNGQVTIDYTTERTIFDLNMKYMGENLTNINIGTIKNGVSDYSKQIEKNVVNKFNLDKKRGDLYPRVIEETNRDGLELSKIFFKSEQDIIVTAILMRNPNIQRKSKAIVVLLNNGTHEIQDNIEKLRSLNSEYGLLMIFDPRGCGAVRSRAVNDSQDIGEGYYDYFGTEFKLSYDSLMLGNSLFGMRVFDVIRAYDFISENFENMTPGLYGEGIGAYYALYAAMAEPGFEIIHLQDLGPSFYEKATTRNYDIDHRLNIHGIIGECDIPHVKLALKQRGINYDW